MMKKLKIFFTCIYIFSIPGITLCSGLPGSKGELLAGAVKINITPPVGTKLRGYGTNKRDKIPSQGIEDSLYVCVLVLEAEGQRIGFISCDLIGYRNKKVLDIAKEKFNIQHLLICSSHTHSGPNLGDEDSKPYARWLDEAIVNGLDEATSAMFPARISAGYTTFPQLGFNRLVIGDDDRAHTIFRSLDGVPYGPVDPDIGVIKVEAVNGRGKDVILMTYACHPVVNGINYEVLADYPGVATKRVEEELGKNTICMFVLGGGGNIDPLMMNRPRSGPQDSVKTNYELKEKMGTYLANEVIKLTKSLSSNNNGQTILRAMSDSLIFTGRFDKNLSYSTHFTTILINNIAIATMHAEPFVQFQQFWRKNAGVDHPFFFGYTYTSGGDYVGYVPDIRSAAYGGYGADDNIRSIEVGAGEAIMNKQLENLYRLRGIMRETPGPL